MQSCRSHRQALSAWRFTAASRDLRWEPPVASTRAHLKIFKVFLPFLSLIFHFGSFWHNSSRVCRIRGEDSQGKLRSLPQDLDYASPFGGRAPRVPLHKWLVALISFRLCSAKGHLVEKNIVNLQKEKCAAGLQQFITLSRGDRSEKCHEVFCNFATGNFGKDELA